MAIAPLFRTVPAGCPPEAQGLAQSIADAMESVKLEVVVPPHLRERTVERLDQLLKALCAGEVSKEDADQLFGEILYPVAELVKRHMENSDPKSCAPG